MASQGVQAGARDSSLHVATPLLRSEALSAALGREVLLKMECAQPSGSFKLRGIGATCKEVRLGAGGEGVERAVQVDAVTFADCRPGFRRLCNSLGFVSRDDGIDDRS